MVYTVCAFLNQLMLESKPSIYIQCRFDINMDFVLKSDQSHYYFLNLFGEMKKIWWSSNIAGLRQSNIC